MVSRPSRWGNPGPAAVHGQGEAVHLYYEHILIEPGLLATDSSLRRAHAQLITEG